MNVVIVEDERLTAGRLENLLHKYDPGIKILALLPSVEQAVEWFNAPPQTPELIFMDVHLEDGLSFRIIEQTELKTPIIFTTAYDEYMVQAFKVNSIDYLLKPINYADLAAAIDKFKSLRQQFTSTAAVPAPAPAQGWPDLQAFISQFDKPRETAYKERFMITVGTKIRSIPTSEIAYFFLEEKVTFLVTQEGLNLPVDYSLDKLTQVLNPAQFFRISRQFLVSLPAIQTIHTYSAGKLKLDLKPKSRQEVFVAGDRMSDFKEWLGK